MPGRPPGQVRDALRAVMRESGGRDVRVQEIIAAVEEKLGGSVAPSSVRSYLQIGSAGEWRRISKGVYRASK